MRFSPKLLIALFFLIFAQFLGLNAVFADKKPVEYFFDKPKFAGAQLSPNGKYLAALVPIQNRMNIAVIDLETNAARNVTSVKEQDISRFLWANNDRLLFFMDKDGNESVGIFAVNRDGTKPRTLAQPSFKSGDIRYTQILSRLDNEDDYILVINNKRRAANPDVYKMNIMNGKQRLIQRNPGDVSNWILDWDDNIVGANFSDGLYGGFRYLNPATGQWEEHVKAKYDGVGFSLVGVKDDGDSAYVSSTMTPDGQQRDKAAIYTYSLKNKKLGELIFEHPEVDIGGIAMREKTKDIMAIGYAVGKPEVVYFDEDFKAIMKRINKALPDTFNSISSMTKDESLAVISSGTDTIPTKYYLYRVADKTIEPVGETRPWVDPELMSEIKPFTINASDGLKLHGYLTVPKNSSGKNLPMIVNPHGGPWARDGWGFNPEIQMLANRGYAVLQVNFRGSTGFGRNHMFAAKKQWGQAMQQDITDSVNWAIAEGIADKDRICIYGASYGGYATMAGLTFTPDMYQCGINYVGVTDIGLLFETMPPSWEAQREYMKDMVGDKQDFLDKWSPSNHADKIKVPVLMGYGKRDPRVDIKHAYVMADAMKKNDVEYELIVEDKEGHGFRKQENVIEWYTKVDEFLQENLN